MTNMNYGLFKATAYASSDAYTHTTESERTFTNKNKLNVISSKIKQNKVTELFRLPEPLAAIMHVDRI